METVGTLLRGWRRRRRMSQLDLAEAAEVSTRHLSCVERGRARPSRQLVLVLASALEVPLRERNVLLQAAGHAPAYRAAPFDDPSLAPVRQALTFLLEANEPNGMLVMDRAWRLLLVNRPFQVIATLALGRALVPGDNLLELSLAPWGFRPMMVDPDPLVRNMLQRLHREAVATGDPELFALLERLVALEGVPGDWRSAAVDDAPAMGVRLQIAGQPLTLFTALTTLGTPGDATLSELRIETWFPADAATRAALEALMPAEAGRRARTAGSPS